MSGKQSSNNIYSEHVLWNLRTEFTLLWKRDGDIQCVYLHLALTTPTSLFGELLVGVLESNTSHNACLSYGVLFEAPHNKRPDFNHINCEWERHCRANVWSNVWAIMLVRQIVYRFVYPCCVLVFDWTWFSVLSYVQLANVLEIY